MGIAQMDDKPINAVTTAKQAAEIELKAIEVFADLCELLDEYAPSWYSEDVHNRAQRALHLLEEVRLLGRVRSGLAGPASRKPPCRSLARGGMSGNTHSRRLIVQNDVEK
jgi:hypothetical protein